MNILHPLTSRPEAVLDEGPLDRGEVVLAWSGHDDARHLVFPDACIACGAPPTERRTLLKHGSLLTATVEGPLRRTWEVTYDVTLSGAPYCAAHASSEAIVEKHWPGVAAISLYGRIDADSPAVKTAEVGQRVGSELLVDELLTVRFDRPAYARDVALANADAVAAALPAPSRLGYLWGSDDKDLRRPTDALRILAQLQDDRALPPFLELITEGYGEKAGAIVHRRVKEYGRAFAPCGAAAVDALLRRMDELVRESAAGRASSPQDLVAAGRPLLARERCLIAIGEFDDPRAEEALLSLVRAGEDALVRRWAANGLSRFREHPEVRRALEHACANDPDEGVRKWAKVALKGRQF